MSSQQIINSISAFIIIGKGSCWINWISPLRGHVITIKAPSSYCAACRGNMAAHLSVSPSIVCQCLPLTSSRLRPRPHNNRPLHSQTQFTQLKISWNFKTISPNFTTRAPSKKIHRFPLIARRVVTDDKRAVPGKKGGHPVVPAEKKIDRRKSNRRPRANEVRPLKCPHRVKHVSSVGR